ncbi:MAG: MCE family protein [Sedimentisphaerales bacterium]|nr:MCE family protein [Sedimentisphaerales bacterium]
MVDYNTAQRRRNVVVGAFVVIAFAGFLGMVYLFGELPVAVARMNSFTVIVEFPSAPGIQQNTPVYYCGYQVGKVIHVMAPETVEDRDTGQPHHKVTVTLAIDKEYRTIPSNTEIVVMKRSMGSSFIELQVDPQREPVLLMSSNPNSMYLCEGLPPLKGEVSMSSEFFPKETRLKLEGLMDSIKRLADNANDVVGDNENKQSVKDALANLRDATARAKDTLASIQGFTDTGSVAIENVAEDLNTTLRDMRDLLSRVRDGDGTTARLLNDGRLYENLLDSSQELEMALEQLKKLAAEAREKGIKLKL